MAESLPKQGEAAPAPKKKHEDVETQNLEKFADYVEESENSEELGKAMNLLENDMQKQNEAKARREMELAKVMINKGDVKLIMQELDMTKSDAERILREHDGNLIDTLHALIL